MFDTTKPGPFYEDFKVGAVLPQLPSVTLTAGDNSFYRAVSGDQNLLTADADIYRAVSGNSGSLANPGLVMQFSIGQTTMATRQAIANLYYRGVRVRGQVEVGESISTATTVLGLKDAAPKDGQHRGKVWLGITTTSGDRTIIEFERVALVRGRSTAQPGHNDQIPGPSDPTPLDQLVSYVPTRSDATHWDISGMPATAWNLDDERVDPLRDHIALAAPLARLTFNQAAVHRDHTLTSNGRRLVYGGHVQALAQASLIRMLPGLAAVVAWDGCDHVGPAYEGDLLEFSHRPTECLTVGHGRLTRLTITGSQVADDGARTEILRWTPVVWAP